MLKTKKNGLGELIGKIKKHMLNCYNYYSLVSLLLGFLKKILFINQYTAGTGFRLFFSGGIIGHKEKICMGNNILLYGWLISDGGKIQIGNNTVIHRGAIIRAKDSILIGDYCDIGADCYIQDHNSMSLDYLERRKKGGYIISKSVMIGNDVWIGRAATILKGIHIGDRAIVGARSVVVHDVPSDCIVVGNPARVVKRNPSKK